MRAHHCIRPPRPRRRPATRASPPALAQVCAGKDASDHNVSGKSESNSDSGAAWASSRFSPLTFSTGWARVGGRTHAQALHAEPAVLALPVALAHVFQHLAAFACEGRWFRSFRSCSRGQRRAPEGVLGLERTLESVLAETLVLVLGAGQAVASVQAGPAVAGAAVHTRPDGSALREAVGQVHLLVVDGHLSGAAV